MERGNHPRVIIQTRRITARVIAYAVTAPPNGGFASLLKQTTYYR